MSILKRILVTLDGSENAERVLPWVKQYAGRQKSEVILFRAVPIAEFPMDRIPSEIEEARTYLLRIEKEINYAGIPCQTRVGTGNREEAIVKAAVVERCDLILMATRGGSPVTRWLLGGVTEKVMRLSPLPVLVVRSQTAFPKQGRVRRIILPLDGSRRAEAALPWGEEMARFLKARLILLHVHPKGGAGYRRSNEEKYSALWRRIERRVADLQRRGVKASCKLQRGDPADRILTYADRQDLILTTTHGRGGFKRWLFGSVAEKLIHAAEVPVLVYKLPAQLKEKARGAAS